MQITRQAEVPVVAVDVADDYTIEVTVFGDGGTVWLTEAEAYTLAIELEKAAARARQTAVEDTRHPKYRHGFDQDPHDPSVIGVVEP